MDPNSVPDALRRIAPFPPTAVAVLHRVPANAGEAYQVADLVASDPQWQADVAQLAAPEAAAEGLEPAAILNELEVDDLVKTAITAAAHAYVHDAGRSELRRYWRYSVACAIASDELARYGKINRALAYSGGLLHDIGRLALMSSYPERYANLLSLAERMFAEGQEFDITEYERILFGMDRYSIAQWLAEAWELPALLVPIVTKYQDTGRVRDLDLITTVRFGCRLANSLGFSLMLGARRAVPRQILGELPRLVQSQWTNFNDLRTTIESRLGSTGLLARADVAH
jgi:HD-like signal output (HDOD) protein